MTKEDLFAPIRERYGELKEALKGPDLERIREITLEVHAMVHPAEISGRKEMTIADYVLNYMMKVNQCRCALRVHDYGRKEYKKNTRGAHSRAD